MSKINSTMSFVLSTNQIIRANGLMASRPNKTPSEMVNQIIEMGLYQLEYRGKQNKRNAEDKRLGRKAREVVNNSDNMLAAKAMGIALGLIVDNEDDSE